MEKLDNLREQIDEIDTKVVELLQNRANLVLKVKAAKAESNIDIYSPAREKEIRARVQDLAKEGSFPRETLDNIFSSIVGATRSLIGHLSIAHSGPRWSRAYHAALRQFGTDVEFVSTLDVNELLDACVQGKYDFGVVPIETSSGGLISKTVSSLLNLEGDSLVVVAEVKLQQSLCLLSNAENRGSVKTILGDAGGFVEAEAWLDKFFPDVVRELVKSREEAYSLVRSDSSVALIGPAEVGVDEDLALLVEDIESLSGGESRFVVFGRKPALPTDNDKTSLLCSVPEKAGALHEVLQFFADRQVNLLKIESKRIDKSHEKFGLAGHPFFFIDLAGNIADANIASALEELRAAGSFVKVLGSYPKAVEMESN